MRVGIAMSALSSATSRSGHCHVRPVKGLKSAGVDVVAHGLNSPETIVVLRTISFASIVCRTSSFSAFERQVAASGGYDYFEQVNVSGDANDFEAVRLGKRAA